MAVAASGWSDELWQQCPKCNELIHKNGGCPSMRCFCGHTFSWTTISSFAGTTKDFKPLSARVLQASVDLGILEDIK